MSLRQATEKGLQNINDINNRLRCIAFHEDKRQIGGKKHSLETGCQREKAAKGETWVLQNKSKPNN